MVAAIDGERSGDSKETMFRVWSSQLWGPISDDDTEFQHAVRRDECNHSH